MILRFKSRLPRGHHARAAGLLALTVLAVVALSPNALRLPGLPLPGGSPRLERVTAGFAWPEFRQTRPVNAPEQRERLRRALARAARAPGRLPPHLPYWRFTLEYGGGRQAVLLASRDLAALALPAEGVTLASPDLRAVLARETAALHRQVFGEPLPWREVDRLWPWDTQATIRDVETGLTFSADRYGGYLHADAQPFTPRDMRIMKRIYRGDWSWRRRAVVVEVGGRRIAASINGMPHGQGTLFDNDFPGHFCVHFTGSVTHGSRRSDLAHRLMITKAAGRLPETLDAAPPDEVARAALVAIYQQDAATLRYAADRANPPGMKTLFTVVDHLEIHGVRPVESPERGQVVVEADVTVYAQPDPDHGYRKTLRLGLVRMAGVAGVAGVAAGWKVRLADLSGLLVRISPESRRAG